jgi:hypothetical protein
MPDTKDASPAAAPAREYGVGRKLIGKDYATPDLYAKVTGQAKYAEDYHADGMLFCKLLLSPMPHARVRSIDARFSPRTICHRRPTASPITVR